MHTTALTKLGNVTTKTFAIRNVFPRMFPFRTPEEVKCALYRGHIAHAFIQIPEHS